MAPPQKDGFATVSMPRGSEALHPSVVPLRAGKLRAMAICAAVPRRFFQGISPHHRPRPAPRGPRFHHQVPQQLDVQAAVDSVSETNGSSTTL